jgi:UDP-N-acetylmuramoyl-L-alanyl-D-glutamate--2,6-diaminopimelate ligase
MAAIYGALASAHAGDVVLIAGKGHEEYQETHGVRVHFSDAETATNALADWRAAAEWRAA